VRLANVAASLVASALAGFAAIGELLGYLQRASTLVFIAYRIGLGILLLVLVAFR
jgi:undecaprenyl-diphosphatase